MSQFLGYIELMACNISVYSQNMRSKCWVITFGEKNCIMHARPQSYGVIPRPWEDLMHIYSDPASLGAAR